MAYLMSHFWPGGTEEQYRATLAAVHPDGGLPAVTGSVEGICMARAARCARGPRRGAAVHNDTVGC